MIPVSTEPMAAKLVENTRLLQQSNFGSLCSRMQGSKDEDDHPTSEHEDRNCGAGIMKGVILKSFRHANTV